MKLSGKLHLFLTIAALLSVVAAVPAQRTNPPATVRDYFLIVAEKYFSIDCCGASVDEYLKNYLKVEDNANGFMSGGGDAAQEGFELALFKRPDKSYLIAFYTEGEGGLEDTPWCRFLTYRNGRLADVSKAVVPNYSKERYIYKLPRRGTTIEVFAKDENGPGFYRGRKLYDLIWQKGKFAVKK
jgi:hypothetical protein